MSLDNVKFDRHKRCDPQKSFEKDAWKYTGSPFCFDRTFLRSVSRDPLHPVIFVLFCFLYLTLKTSSTLQSEMWSKYLSWVDPQKKTKQAMPKTTREVSQRRGHSRSQFGQRSFKDKLPKFGLRLRDQWVAQNWRTVVFVIVDSKTHKKIICPNPGYLRNTKVGR